MPVMNAYQKAVNQYKNNSAMYASGPVLTLMLYDGAIKFLNIAEMAIEKDDVQKAHTNIVKTEHIIDYLQNTLDMKYATAKDFDNMYQYISRRLVEANLNKDIEIVKEVNEHIHSIRDTWVQVMKANNVAVPSDLH